MLDEMMLKQQNKRDRLFVLLFLYNKNMKMNRPKTDSDVAVYGITFRDWSVVAFILFHANDAYQCMIDFN